jgi:hypothetical protein
MLQRNLSILAGRTREISPGGNEARRRQACVTGWHCGQVLDPGLEIGVIQLVMR